MSFYSLTDFLEPVHLAMVSGDAEIREGQIGKTLMIYEDEMPDLSTADVVIASCNDLRGDGDLFKEGAGTDKIRKEFYALYQWHKDIKIADIGNIRSGASVSDTYAAVKAVATECLNLGKRFLLLGGSHDLTLALYEGYQSKGKIIEATGVEAYIDL